MVRVHARLGWVVFVATLGASATGCIDDFGVDDNDRFGDPADCTSLCEEAKSCPGSDQTVDCDDECAEAERANESAGCVREYDDLLECAADADLCDLSDSCESETNRYTDCVITFCDDYPEECPF